MERTVVIPVVLSLYMLTTVQPYVIQAYESQPSDKKGITCWTCPNKTDNEACNNWAPDFNCPTNHSVCQTFHKFDSRTGKSLEVHKRCAQPTECTMQMVGCKDTKTPGVKECMTCCNQDYCNELIPSNHTSAIMLSTLMPNSALSKAVSWTLFLTTLTLMLSIGLSQDRTLL